MLCSLDDVMNILVSSEFVPEDTVALRDQLEPLRDAVDNWIHMAYNANWDQTPNAVITEKFFDKSQDAILKLGDINPTNISIKVYAETPDDYIADLFDDSSQFVYLGDGKIRLTMSFFVTVPGFPNIWTERLLQQFIEVDVTYTASGIIPPAVKYATALITAATYAQQGTDITNIHSETIGGYSYSVYDPTHAVNQGLIIPERARRFLQPFLRGLNARAI